MAELPWVEKYRPEGLKQVIGHDTKIRTLENLIASGNLPHLLFYGPPGTGKTSTILAVARTIYGAALREHVLELNASDERGIDTVRNEIRRFTQIKSPMVRLVILDEADAMTHDAQNALKRQMERVTKNCRFCLICNNINRIVPGVKDRCNVMRFGQLPSESIISRLQEIVRLESVQIEESGLIALVRCVKDFRQILHTLQCLHHRERGDGTGEGKTGSLITEAMIYEYLDQPSPREIQALIESLQNREFSTNYQHLKDLLVDNRWGMNQLIMQMCDQLISDTRIPPEVLPQLVDKLAQINDRLSDGKDPQIQMAALALLFARLPSPVVKPVVPL